MSDIECEHPRGWCEGRDRRLQRRIERLVADLRMRMTQGGLLKVDHTLAPRHAGMLAGSSDQPRRFFSSRSRTGLSGHGQLHEREAEQRDQGGKQTNGTRLPHAKGQ
jgi:hypothetical protein